MGSNMGQGRFHDCIGLWNTKASEGSAWRNVGFAQASSSTQVWDAVAHITVNHCPLCYLNHREITNKIETCIILASCHCQSLPSTLPELQGNSKHAGNVGHSGITLLSITALCATWTTGNWQKHWKCGSFWHHVTVNHCSLCYLNLWETANTLEMWVTLVSCHCQSLRAALPEPLGNSKHTGNVGHSGIMSLSVTARCTEPQGNSKHTENVVILASCHCYHCPWRYLNHRETANTLEMWVILASWGSTGTEKSNIRKVISFYTMLKSSFAPGKWLNCGIWVTQTYKIRGGGQRGGGRNFTKEVS